MTSCVSLGQHAAALAQIAVRPRSSDFRPHALALELAIALAQLRRELVLWDASALGSAAAAARQVSKTCAAVPRLNSNANVSIPNLPESIGIKPAPRQVPEHRVWHGCSTVLAALARVLPPDRRGGCRRGDLLQLLKVRRH